VKLTPKQERFAAAYVDTGNASEAYRRAYNTANMKPATIQRRAREALKNGLITARIEELRKELAACSLWSRMQSVKALINIVNNPDKAADVIAAVRELNAMHGYNAPARIDHTSSDGSMAPSQYGEQLLELLRKRHGSFCGDSGPKGG